MVIRFGKLKDGEPAAVHGRAESGGEFTCACA